MTDLRPAPHQKEPSPEEAQAQAQAQAQAATQGAQQQVLKGQTLNEAVQGLSLTPQKGEESKPKEDLSGASSRPAASGGDGGTSASGNMSPERFKALFKGKDLNEAVALLIPNINHALKVGSTARKNEHLIRAMKAENEALMMVSMALKSFIQNTNTSSLAAQMSSNSQNQNTSA